MAMFLQEVGKEISEANIRKIFAALDIELDHAKVQFFIPALSILANANQKKIKTATEASIYQQLGRLQKQFEAFGSAMAPVDERLTKHKPEQPADGEIFVANEKVDGMVELEKKPVTNSMKQVEELVTNMQAEAPLQAEMVHDLPARYVYGVADKGVRINLETKGLDGALVYTIPYKEMCIVVHDCVAEPYKSEDEAIVKDWLFTQQEVLDDIAEKFGVVLPMSFDMIIEGRNGQEPEQMVKDWLEKNYDNFMEKISKLRGKQEYGVQVILDTESLSANLIETDEKLKKKKKEIDAKPEGIAYMEREILKDLLKERIEEAADQYFREFYGRIRECTDDIVIGKVKKVGGNKQMLMNLSCLVRKDMVGELGKELEEIENISGMSVRFSGPWAPYSFVTPDKGVAENA